MTARLSDTGTSGRCWRVLRAPRAHRPPLRASSKLGHQALCGPLCRHRALHSTTVPADGARAPRDPRSPGDTREGQPRPRLRSPGARDGTRTPTPAWHRPLPRRHPIKTPVLFSVTSCTPCPGWVTKRLDKPHCARMWLGHSRSPRGHADFPGGSLRDVCGDRRACHTLTSGSAHLDCP